MPCRISTARNWVLLEMHKRKTLYSARDDFTLFLRPPGIPEKLRKFGKIDKLLNIHSN